jgi:hypothetical protein
MVMKKGKTEKNVKEVDTNDKMKEIEVAKQAKGRRRR